MLTAGSSSADATKDSKLGKQVVLVPRVEAAAIALGSSSSAEDVVVVTGCVRCTVCISFSFVITT